MTSIKKFLCLLLTLGVLLSIGTGAYAENSTREPDSGDGETPAVEIATLSIFELDESSSPESGDSDSDVFELGDTAAADTAQDGCKDEEQPATDDTDSGKAGEDSYYQAEGGTGVYEKGDETEDLTGITISSLKVDDLGTGYSVLVFEFSDGGEKYEATLTGIKNEFAQNINEDNTYAMNSMKLIAYYFLKEKDSSSLTGCTQQVREYPNEDGTHNLIDAEKISEKGFDSELCWAATASNMLWLTGWAQNICDADENIVFSSEDEVFSYFCNNFVDDGSRDYYGFKWFFNGINMDQIVEDGKVVYSNKVYEDKYSQLKVSGSTGLVPDVAAENAFLTYSGSTLPAQSTGLSEFAELLKKGFAIGLSLGNYENEEGQDIRSGGHAVTLMGYIKQIGENVSNALKGLFIADSDNDKDVDNIPADKRTNSYTLYLTDEVTLTNGVTGYSLGGYNGDGENFVLDNFTVLFPSSGRDEIKETDSDGNATLDPSTTLDFVPYSLTVSSTDADVSSLKIGDTVNISTMVQNMSYIGADGIMLQITYTIKKDGEAFGDPITTNVELGSVAPLDRFTISGNYTFSEPGAYMVEVNIDDVLMLKDDDLYHSIVEAYLSNNKYSGSCSFNINTPEKDSGTDYEKKEPEATKVYAASFKSDNAAENLVIAFEAGFGLESTDQFVELFHNNKNTVVDTSNFKIVQLPDGSFELRLNSRYLRTLAPGLNTFVLRTVFGDELVYIFQIDIN